MSMSGVSFLQKQYRAHAEVYHTLFTPRTSQTHGQTSPEAPSDHYGFAALSCPARNAVRRNAGSLAGR